MSEEIKIGNYISLRSKWVSANLGYTLPTMTMRDWDRYYRTPQGQLHRQNRQILTDAFDESVWPKVVEAASVLVYGGDPLPVPESWQKSANEEEADRRATQKAFQNMFSPRRRR